MSNYGFPNCSLSILHAVLLSASLATAAWADSPGTRDCDWLKFARYGIFMHFLPHSDASFAVVDKFDVDALTAQLETAGAKYFTITLGQNSGYFISPNAAYDKITGYAPGERCARRDLPLELAKALKAKGIRLMLYLPCQAPNGDARAQRAFGLRQGSRDQPIDEEFARKWGKIIEEWSDRYGESISGWWFDGGYEHIHFNEAIARIYSAAAKHGNPHALVTFNPGVKLIRYTKAEDYTAGELNEPFSFLPAGRWVDGSQWHALTYLGSSWSQRDTRYPAEKWAAWVKNVVDHEGAVTLDMGPNWNPQAGPIGSLAAAQMKQFKVIQAAIGQETAKKSPKRLTRAESFFGIHFDFHAGSDCQEIGKRTTRQMIENIINQAHPDYIQIDCKGHPGLSSYPTKVGNQAPGFVGDPLRLWRQVTAEHGVALYMHYSGVWDSEAIRLHPAWAAVNADGTTNPNATSFFGPYADKLLIPQLRELAGEYGVDGAWVDGECWASVPDYGDAAVKAFRQSTGIQDIPRKPGDPHWFEFLQFHREAFRNHLRRYIADVRKTNPEMQLCSNWAFTDHMPEAICAPVDWISGDFSPEDAVNSARFSARYMARQGKPWDLMAWGFTTTPQRRNGSRDKSFIQLQREAAVVLAWGGGFQSYYNQRRDGSVPEEHLPVIAEVAKFCRARQAVCHRATPVPQIALLYSTASHYREVNGLFQRDLSRIRGTLQALLESQQVVDVVSEHNLAGHLAEYPLIVVTECDYLEPSFKKELIAYVHGGGKLLLIGPQAAAMFASELGVTPAGQMQFAPRYLARGDKLEKTNGATWSVTLSPDRARHVGEFHAANDVKSPAQTAASIARLGRGSIAATYFCFSQGYLGNRSVTMRGFLMDLVHQLLPKPMVEVKGSADVDVSVGRLGGRLMVNLVNTAGPHDEPRGALMDSILPVGPLQITIRLPKQPTTITQEPGGQKLAFEYRDGETQLTVPRLEIHCVIAVETGSSR
jgi:hypothetical protein